MTVAELHSNYKEKHPDEKVYYDLYRTFFVSMKISSTKLGEEECEVCERFKQHECPKNLCKAEDIDNDDQTCESFRARSMKITSKEQKNHVRFIKKMLHLTQLLKKLISQWICRRF